jgi:hypothetical protein
MIHACMRRPRASKGLVSGANVTIPAMAKQETDLEYLARQRATAVRSGRAVGFSVVLLVVLGLVALIIWGAVSSPTKTGSIMSGTGGKPTAVAGSGKALANHVDAQQTQAPRPAAVPESSAQHGVAYVGSTPQQPSATTPPATATPAPSSSTNASTVDIQVQIPHVISVTKRTTPTSRADLENVYCDYAMSDGTTKAVYYGTESAPGWGGFTTTCNSHP